MNAPAEAGTAFAGRGEHLGISVPDFDFCRWKPFGNGRRFASHMPRAVDTALGGWQLTAINTDTSGQPVNLTYSPAAAYQLSPLLSQRPNVSGKPINPSSSWVKTSSALNGYLSTTNVTLPGDPSNGFENDAMKKSAATCAGEWWKM